MTREELEDLYNQIQTADNDIDRWLALLAYKLPRINYITENHVREWAMSWGLHPNTKADDIKANTDFVQLPWETSPPYGNGPYGVVMIE